MMVYKKIFLLFLSVSYLFASGSNRYAKISVVNEHTYGGPLMEWLFVGPYSTKYDTTNIVLNDTLNDSVPLNKIINNGGSFKDINPMTHDFLTFYGGESVTLISRNDRIVIDNGLDSAQIIKPRYIVTDSLGILSFDSLISENTIVYAFSLIEVFHACTVRCYYGVDGDMRLFLNGSEVLLGIDSTTSYIQRENYIDLYMKEGTNSFLVKLSGQKGKGRFCFELYDRKDSLRLYEKFLKNITIEPLPREFFIDSTIIFDIKGNIPLIKGSINGTMYIEKYDAIDPICIDSLQVTVGEEKKYKLPQGINGVIRIYGIFTMGKNIWETPEQFLFCGSLMDTFETVKKRIVNIDLNSFKWKNQLCSLAVIGYSGWAKDFFNRQDDLHFNERIRQFLLSAHFPVFIDSMRSNNKLLDGRLIPWYLPQIVDSTNFFVDLYDPVQWLNYKYPDRFKQPQDIAPINGYHYWIRYPKRTSKRFSALPVTLMLHSEIYRDSLFTNLSHHPFITNAHGNNYDSKSLILIPHCAHESYWQAPYIFTQLDRIIKTSKINQQRIALTGEGMGGFECWHLAVSMPTFFSAIVPLNSGGQSKNICEIIKLPMHIYHGVKNEIVPTEIILKMVHELKTCGRRTIDIKLLSENGEDIASIIYSNPHFFKWILKQR